METAISASRRRQRRTSILMATRSVAGIAMDTVAASSGGTLTGKKLLVVGAGKVASVVVARAVELQAAVTVCNRTRRHAHRFAEAGATLVDLANLSGCLATSDIAILATTAPRPLVDISVLRSARPPYAGPLTLVDLSMPRNVDPLVRALPRVRLIDLADLRSHGMNDARDLLHDLAAAEEIVETELRRYTRWLAGRSAAAELCQMRSDAEAVARDELARIASELPAEIHSCVERVLLRTVHRLVHKPTLELRAAGEAGNADLVAVLARLFDATSPSGRLAAEVLSPTDRPGAARAGSPPSSDAGRPA
jgi:glutamyl-tRNA reductase